MRGLGFELNNQRRRKSVAVLPVYPSAGYGSASFNGSNQGLSNSTNSVDLQFGTGDFTTEFWMYPTGGLAGYVVVEIGRLEVGPGTGFQFSIISGVLQFYYGPSISNILIGPSVSVNTWYHVAVSRSGGNLKLFVNGTQYGSTVTDTTNYNQSYLWIGVNASGFGYYYSGYLTNIRAIKGTSIYNSNFIPSTSPLTAIPETTLLTSVNNSGLTVTDVSPSNLSINNPTAVTYNAITPFTT